MKRKFEKEDSSSSAADSSNDDEQENIPTKSIRNRSRKYVDNIVQSQPTTQHQQQTSATSRNSSPSRNIQNIALSFPFVASSVKVPTNRRHLKLRKQLKNCSDFTSSYFVLDMNAPATSTIGFMGSHRGNDIPVLLNETVSNNNFSNSQINTSPPPAKKKSKTSKKSSSTTRCVASVNTTVSSSPSTCSNLNTNLSNSTAPQAPSLLQQLTNVINNNNSMNHNCSTIGNMSTNTSTLIQNILPLNHSTIQNPQNPQNLVQSIHSFQQNSNMNNIQSMMNQSFLQNIPQQTNIHDKVMNCFNTSPLIGLSNYSNSLDASPMTPSTPSTSNGGISSPNVGSLMMSNCNNSLQQVNSLINGNTSNNTSNSFGMVNQNTGYSNSNLNNYNQASQQLESLNLQDYLTQDEARLLLYSMYCYNNSNNSNNQ